MKNRKYKKYSTVFLIQSFLSASNFVGKPLAKWLLPKVDASIDKKISKKLRKVEQQYKDTIIQQVKEQTALWGKCKEISES